MPQRRRITALTQEGQQKQRPFPAIKAIYCESLAQKPCPQLFQKHLRPFFFFPSTLPF